MVVVVLLEKKTHDLVEIGVAMGRLLPWVEADLRGKINRHNEKNYLAVSFECSCIFLDLTIA